MIFYFSGTGNSKWIAEQIARVQNETLVFMPNAIRDGIKEFVLADNEKVGLFFLFIHGDLRWPCCSFWIGSLWLIITPNMSISCVLVEMIQD